MKDSFGRQIDYLRLSVTDRCNLRCIYCHDGYFVKAPRQDVITAEEISLLISYLKKRGLKEVKLTGGEPLLRADLTQIIKNLVDLGLGVSLTTNATMLADKAESLFEAGLRRINIGLDCLNGPLFQKVTGSNSFDEAMEGLNKTIEVGFSPVKINVVLIQGLNDNVRPWLELIKEKEVVVRFVEVMPFVNGFKLVNNSWLKEEITKVAALEPVIIKGSGPAKHYSLAGYKGNIGFVSSRSSSFCEGCNRLRVDVFGRIRNCLFSQEKFDFLSIARNGCSEEKIGRLIDDILLSKPESNEGLIPEENMCVIGG
jgi:cyclic pyranopterin phosphate synthase